jgi:hypothetical protein
MFCDRCGVRLNDAQQYCPSCGKPVGTIPLMPVQGRIAGHVRLLGILWLASAAVHLIPGFVMITLFGNHGRGIFPPDVPFFVPGMLHFIGILFLAGAVLNLLAGWGLLDRQPWARTLAIVLACFNLLHMPFGTALGIYTLWVLLPAKSEEEYRRFARVA